MKKLFLLIGLLISISVFPQKIFYNDAPTKTRTTVAFDDLNYGIYRIGTNMYWAINGDSILRVLPTGLGVIGNLTSTTYGAALVTDTELGYLDGATSNIQDQLDALSPTIGTVTSVDMSVPTGLTISGNPITTSGTLALSLTAGYEIPTSAFLGTLADTADVGLLATKNIFTQNQTITATMIAQNGNISSDDMAVKFGADFNGTTITNATRKLGHLGVPHYTNAEEPITFGWLDSQVAFSKLFIGGGLGGFNSATQIEFYTGATTSTLAGTLALTIAEDQTITAASSFTASSLIKDGGTSSQFLKADGTVDGTTYLSSTAGDWTGTFDGQEGTYYLDYNNFTNTPSTLPTSSDFQDITDNGASTTNDITIGQFLTLIDPTTDDVKMGGVQGVGGIGTSKIIFQTRNTTMTTGMTLDENNDLTVVGDVFGNNLAISNWNTAYGWGDWSTSYGQLSTRIGTDSTNLADNYTNTTDLTTLLSGKEDVITGAATTITSLNLTANRALHSTAAGKVGVSSVSSLELSYLLGVTSDVQTQLNAMADTATINNFDLVQTFRAEPFFDVGALVGSGDPITWGGWSGGVSGSRIYGTTSADMTFYTAGQLVLTLDNLGNADFALAVTATKGLFGNGTAFLPSHSFSGDTDNGMYRVTTNSIGFATAGAAALTIDASGNSTFYQEGYFAKNLGVGTTSPVDLLQVESTTTNAFVGIVSENSSIAGIDLGDTDAIDQGRIRYANSTETMSFGTAGSTYDNTITIVGGNVNMTRSGTTLTVGTGADNGTVSAGVFVDRTKFYDGDALAELSLVAGKDGEIIHSTLPEFAQVRLKKDTIIFGEKIIIEEVNAFDGSKLKDGVKFDKTTGEYYTQTETIERIETGVIERDLGGMISILTKAVQQLTAQNEALVVRINELEKK